MPSRPRRTNFRSSRLPVRVTSYRVPDAEQILPHPAPPLPLNRTAIATRLKTSRRIGTLEGCHAAFTVTADQLSITLPVPPSINHQYATVNGRRLLSSAGRSYKTQVGQQLWVALARSSARDSLMGRLQSEPLALSIRFFFTSALRRDVDGGLKIAQDALCEGLGLNDNRIVETHLYKEIDKTHPRIEVSLSPASTRLRPPSAPG